ncbi:ABC transporter permease [Occultella kanbiaonis]|uniref:ABC transporter permease n=1 Tax=Occultella kanbiaonis TaxID=2675754 RepID=UPI0012B6C706|nr:ABC transporter permease [Occultella kanbiaonis]
MLTFIIRRVLIGLGILLVSSFLLYLLVDLVMDPLEDLVTSTDPNKEFQIAERTALLELDKPAVQRYFEWLGGVVTGDLGTAWRTNRPVSELLQGAIISTIQLVSAATVLSIVLGVAVGIVSALRQYSGFDYLITFVSFLLFSLPSFWVAVLLKQWGAIGFNDFLADPWIAWGVIIGLGLIAGFLWQLAIGGVLRRRLINAAIGAAATIGALAFLQLSGWWEQPNIGPVILAVTSVVIAFAVTALSTGLKNRRALYTALTCAALGVALWYPVRFYLFYYLTDYMNWGIVALLGLLAAAVGIGIGVLFRGPDWKQSARTGGIVAFLVAGLIFIDQVMSVWGPYYNSNAINGRPIPTIGDRTPNLGGNWWVGVLDSYTHLLLPTLALMLISFAGYTRYSRGSMLEVMNQDYIRTARAKGLTERTVVVRHGFRNSLIPLATIVPLDVITLIGGAIITERIFGRPGMGQLFLQSLATDDIEPVMAYLLIVAFLAIVANIVADLIYAVLDPRIRVNA